MIGFVIAIVGIVMLLLTTDHSAVAYVVKGGFELSFYGGLKMHDLGGLRINRC